MSRHHRPFSPRAMLAPAIILLLALSGCASHASGHARGNQPTSPVSTSHSTPTATATTTTSSRQTNTTCSTNGGSPLTIQKMQVGRDGEYDRDTWEWLPDTLPLTPQALSSASPVALGTMNSSLTIDVEITPPPASQPAYVCGVTVRITSFQPLSGQVANVYHQCVDQFYLDPGGFEPSSACPANGLAAGVSDTTFTSSNVGATATAAVNSMLDPNQPAQEPPNTPAQGAGLTDILVGVHVPQPGLYTFAVSLWQDNSGPSVTGPSVTAMFLFGQARHEWGGQPCTQPAMRAQLPPATNPPTQVICPGGAPTVQ